MLFWEARAALVQTTAELVGIFEDTLMQTQQGQASLEQALFNGAATLEPEAPGPTSAVVETMAEQRRAALQAMRRTEEALMLTMKAEHQLEEAVLLLRRVLRWPDGPAQQTGRRREDAGSYSRSHRPGLPRAPFDA